MSWFPHVPTSLRSLAQQRWLITSCEHKHITQTHGGHVGLWSLASYLECVDVFQMSRLSRKASKQRSGSKATPSPYHHRIPSWINSPNLWSQRNNPPRWASPCWLRHWVSHIAASEQQWLKKSYIFRTGTPWAGHFSVLGCHFPRLLWVWVQFASWKLHGRSFLPPPAVAIHFWAPESRFLYREYCCV